MPNGIHPSPERPPDQNPEIEGEFEPTEKERVEAWRLEKLLEAGCPIEIAELIAANTKIDLHIAEKAFRGGKEKGVSPARIFEGLWPAEDDLPEGILGTDQFEGQRTSHEV